MATNGGGFWPRWDEHKLFFVLLAILMVYATVLVFVHIEKTIVEVRGVGFADQTAPTISVTGEGKASAVPDIAKVDMIVTNKAANTSAAQSVNTTVMNGLIAAMRNAGVAEKDLKTSSYSVYPVYDYDVSPATITGYEASQTLSVTIRDTEKSGAILEAAGSNGATQIGSLRMEVDDETDVKSEARKAAIADARAEAESIAAAMDARLGRVVSYYESEGGSMGFYYEGAMLSDSMKVGAPDIAEGENETNITVTMTYAIQ